MSKKSELKKRIAETERELEALENKRARSQSALMRAMLTNQKPDPMDEKYFKVFSNLIDEEREKLRKLLAELENL